jgi:hypothetical protein
MTPEDEAERKRKDERRKRHKEKRERMTLPPNLEFYPVTTWVLPLILNNSQEETPAEKPAEPSPEPESDPNVRIH